MTRTSALLLGALLGPACVEPAVQGTSLPSGADSGSDSDDTAGATGGSTTADPTTGATTSSTTSAQTGAPSCSDGVLNQDESDVDCGGSCTPCDGGAACGDATDCKSGQCDAGACFPLFRSCLELHTERPGLPDGPYPLDPDGDGANPRTFECDMLGGGWTQIVADDFAPPSAPWDPLTTGSCGAYAEILGPFGMGAQVKLDVTAGGVPHTSLRLLAEAIIMDSWDTVPAETLSVRVDGQEVFNQFCDYTASFQCNQEANVCGHMDFPDGKILINPEPFAHAADAIAVELSDTLNEAPDNESWGLDNLAIHVK